MKKTLSLILAVLMLLGCMTVTVFAENDPPTTPIDVTIDRPLSYDIVIPEAVHITSSGDTDIGRPAVENVKNAKYNTVIQYTATGTDLKKSDNEEVILPATYYTESGMPPVQKVLNSDPIRVYQGKTVVSGPLLVINIDSQAWNVAEDGTYNGSVVFNFEAKEVPTVGTVLATWPKCSTGSIVNTVWTNGTHFIYKDKNGDLALDDTTGFVKYEEELTPTDTGYSYIYEAGKGKTANLYFAMTEAGKLDTIALDGLDTLMAASGMTDPTYDGTYSPVDTVEMGTIIATASDFPTTNLGNIAWTNGTFELYHDTVKDCISVTSCAYVDQKILAYVGDFSVPYATKVFPLGESGNYIIFAKDGLTFTFDMSEGKLTDIDVQLSAMGEMVAKSAEKAVIATFSNKYKSTSVTRLATVLASADGGFPTTPASGWLSDDVTPHLIFQYDGYLSGADVTDGDAKDYSKLLPLNMILTECDGGYSFSYGGFASEKYIQTSGKLTEIQIYDPEGRLAGTYKKQPTIGDLLDATSNFPTSSSDAWKTQDSNYCVYKDGTNLKYDFGSGSNQTVSLNNVVVATDRGDGYVVYTYSDQGIYYQFACDSNTGKVYQIALNYSGGSKYYFASEWK